MSNTSLKQPETRSMKQPETPSMKPITLLTILCIALVICSCNQSGSDKSSEEAKLYVVDFDNPDGNIDLQLTDLAENFRIVPLETTDESLIGNGMYYVSESYILAYTQNGIYKFSANGKFIKKIVAVGKGPQEISQMIMESSNVVDEENGVLYINDYQHTNEILVYDVVGEKFLDPVKKYITGYWTSFTVSDGVILAAPGNLMAQPDSARFAVLHITTKGDFISGIKATRKVSSSFNEEGYNYLSATIMKGSDFNLVRYSNADTIFAYRNDILEPYIIFSYNKPQADEPSELPQKGDRLIRINNNVEPVGFIILSAPITGDTRSITTPDGYTAFMIETTQDYFLLDKSSGNFKRIISYTDNISGERQEIDQVNQDRTGYKLPSFLSNGKLIRAYNSFELMDLVEDGFAESSMPDELKDQLMEVAGNLKEDDNPVLLIGDLK